LRRAVLRGTVARQQGRCAGGSWLIPVVQTEGHDVSRSAAAGAGAEAVWVPTALLPRYGVNWTAEDVTHVAARYTVDKIPASSCPISAPWASWIPGSFPTIWTIKHASSPQ
jgi:hypothetical protein